MNRTSALTLRPNSNSDDQFVVVPAAHHDRVDLDASKPSADGGVDPGEDGGQLVEPRQRLEAIAVQRVETDRDAVQARGAQRVRLARQQDPVGCQRQVLDRRLRREQFDQLRQVAAEQRLAAREPHPIHAERGERVHQHGDFFEVEDALARQPRVVRLRHAVLAAQVAPVGDRHAEAAQRAARSDRSLGACKPPLSQGYCGCTRGSTARRRRRPLQLERDRGRAS